MCRHNLSYWERKNYLGFGVGAASLLCEQRYTNTDSLAFYMDAMNKLISYKAGVRQNDSLSALSAIRTEQHTLSVPEQMEHLRNEEKENSIYPLVLSFGAKRTCILVTTLKLNINMSNIHS